MGQRTMMTMTSARLTLAVSLSVILSACASGHGPSAMASAPKIDNGDRFSGDQTQANSHSTAVPRVYVNADQIEEDAPESYEVVRGDTLWDISDRFLKEPWLWNEIWSYNPQVYNPHLIYPGDKLALEYVNGKPTLSLTRNGKAIPRQALNANAEPTLGAATPTGTDASGTARVKLSPRIRSESLDDAIPTISHESISQFLVHPRVVQAGELASAPYVIANSDERLISSMGSKIYVRGQINSSQTSYGVFRKNKALIDPVNGANLGYEMTHVSDAKLLSVGDPSTFALTVNKQETISGDVLFSTPVEETAFNYTPRLPILQGDGRIVSLVNAIAQTGQNQVVVLNVGSDSSIQEGDILAVETRGKTVPDRTSMFKNEHVALPNQRTGVLMVFKTFDRVSYALVMESTRPLKVNDIITGI